MPANSTVWIVFNLFILAMLALDQFIFHRKAHVIKMREALGWSAVWISLAFLFNIGIYFWHGKKPALEFLTGYLIEESLSIDNLFVFLVIFSYFKVPAIYQHKILFWGILCAQIMRGAFIFAGIKLIHQFHWIIYIFGAFLIMTGIKLFMQKDQEFDPGKNPVLTLTKRVLPVTDDYHGDKFFTRSRGKLLATPLFIVFIFVNVTDFIFALDSIPAILAITLDPFIVYSSNVFAILGLRALYFVLARFMELFHYLHYGLAAILVFVGAKMMLVDVINIPIGIALGFVVMTLLISVLASLKHSQQSFKKP